MNAVACKECGYSFENKEPGNVGILSKIKNLENIIALIAPKK